MSRYLEGKFALIAHRGGSLEAPENTLAAFENATRVFKDIFFELDVQPTKDGEIVVIHDGDVDRTTEGHGKVSDFLYKDLEKLDGGYRFSQDGGKTYPFRGKGVKIPRLIDVLETFSSSRICIEIKSGLNFFGDKVAKAIEVTKAQDRVCIAGENYQDLVKTSKLLPGVCTGYSKRELFINFVLDRLLLPPILASKRGDVMQIPNTYNNNDVATPRFLRKAQANTKLVHVWTVNERETMRHLIDIGVDGIITDAPTLLLTVAREAKKI